MVSFSLYSLADFKCPSFTFTCRVIAVIIVVLFKVVRAVFCVINRLITEYEFLFD